MYSNNINDNNRYSDIQPPNHNRTISIERKSAITMTLTSPIETKAVTFASSNENISYPTYTIDNNSNMPTINLYNNYEGNKFTNYINDTKSLFSEIISNDNYNTDSVLNSLSTTNNLILGGLKTLNIDSNESSSNINKSIEDLQGTTLLLSKDNINLINLQKSILKSNRIMIIQNAISQQYNLIMTFDKKDDNVGFDFKMYPENKYISLKKRSLFIIKILTLFLSENGFEIPNTFFIRLYNEQGREEFRNSLRNYLYSILGSKPRLFFKEDEKKYIMFES
jgi:hypothetical protein